MRFIDRLRFRSSHGARRGPHMTFSATRTGRTMTRAGTYLKKRIWIWPIIAVVLLASIGLIVRRAIESTMKKNLESQLTTLLNVETAMLGTWLNVETATTESSANDLQVREIIYKMIAHDPPSATPDVGLLDPTVHRQLQQELGSLMASHDFVGYIVADEKKLIVSASSQELVGRNDIVEFDAMLSRALDGHSAVTPPFPSVAAMKDEYGKLRTGVPTMYVAAPVRDASFRVVAALAFQVRPERKFTQILQLGRIGESGETYAFDKTGTMVSNSRFDSDLILLGLLADNQGSRSILNIQVRDPGGNIIEGFRPTRRRAELPLTKMAADAVAGNTNVNVEGYRDYRGVPVVGAWTWMSDFNMGVTTEVDVAEAFRPLTILQWTFWGLYSLLGISSLAIFVFTLVVAKLQRDAQKAVVEAKQLGQYRLEKELGAGAMGVVYKGHHAMLRRPTAVKMLNLSIVNDEMIAYFEREVQITCQLTHPNTIAIYDYGRTPEGVFYYAMEYLDGIDLQSLVGRYGPQREGRVRQILLQICGSLNEAHTKGLVHRDIKPANIMLNRRGGEPDVVKVLDFGLVKSVDEEGKGIGSDVVAGTPLYMSPEAIQTPKGIDARSDLYAVGALGYFLLTGRPVFEAKTIRELLQLHVDATPLPPSKVLGKPINERLESALLACLEKSRSKRPQTARALAQLIERVGDPDGWSTEDAEAWWGRHERQPGDSGSGSNPAGSNNATMELQRTDTRKD